MKRPALALLILCIVGGIDGCKGYNKSYTTEPAQTSDAQDLWDSIHTMGYHDWLRAPGYSTRRLAHSPHGDSIDIFVNPVVQATLTGGAHATTWPKGSIIVKDGFVGSAQTLVAVIEKRDDGWFWAEYGVDGKVLASGHPSACLGCHVSGSDYVRAFTLP